MLCVWRCSFDASAYLLSGFFALCLSQLFLFHINCSICLCIIIYCTRLITSFFFHFFTVTDVPAIFTTGWDCLFCRFFRFSLFHFSLSASFIFPVGITVRCIFFCSNYLHILRGLGLSDFRFPFLLCFAFPSAELSDFFQTAFRSVCLLTLLKPSEFPLLCNSKAYCS